PFAPDLLLSQDALAEAREIGDQLAVVSKIYWSICDVAHWLTSDRAVRCILTWRLSVFDAGQLCSQSRELRFESGQLLGRHAPGSLKPFDCVRDLLRFDIHFDGCLFVADVVHCDPLFGLFWEQALPNC